MKRVFLILALLLSATVAAQDKEAKPPAKKPLAKKKQAAHAKPTPEQIRKFNQLQKKQQEPKP